MATADDRDRWRRFVTDHPEATVFHSWAWHGAVRDAFDYQPAHRLITERGGSEPVGIVPGFSVPGVFERTLVNPFCEYGFPLLADGVDSVAVLRELADGLGRTGARILKDAGWTGLAGYNPAGYGAVRTGEVSRLDTVRAFETVREQSFTGEARRCLRSALDNGVTVRPASVTEYYPLYLSTMRRLGSPQFPETFFVDLAGELGDDLSVFLAERDGDTIGGILLLDFGSARIIWSNASQQDAWEYHPNYRLYAAVIEDACATDIDVVDFGRSRPGTGVHSFKQQFGGDPSPLSSFVTPPHRANRASLEGYGRVAAVAERLGRVVTNPIVGPRLKRFIHE
ncbi:Peptidoglycan interpeptide bridge formation enzyme, contains acetyltransferase domain of GNAT superfamily [Halapricum desulfuricans]|uniref:Peptidoglycan interpeptide bridge formation enzyme, contains acetyltransferase domain of GNAT superfamily n=1 Tax=Halapricum desulfuricans TaxID=2841257 RepID=A0A897NKE5_9EURY|nr:Peptidoglycan interpeptide bridge formation enzyme, contains acetyltransferase domain of GNAT superfamily [Halapricum desulfuricans]